MFHIYMFRAIENNKRLYGLLVSMNDKQAAQNFLAKMSNGYMVESEAAEKVMFLEVVG